uniref:Uncharacterized protein n=1 Tax=Panagrellus redivivus TaxID=6233 RepID=A0A7E4V0A0_PANRE
MCCGRLQYDQQRPLRRQEQLDTNLGVRPPTLNPFLKPLAAAQPEVPSHASILANFPTKVTYMNALQSPYSIPGNDEGKTLITISMAASMATKMASGMFDEH